MLYYEFYLRNEYAKILLTSECIGDTGLCHLLCICEVLFSRVMLASKNELERVPVVSVF